MDFTSYVDHALRGCDFLDSLYHAIAEKPIEEKLKEKEQALRRIIKATDTLSLQILSNPAHKRLEALPNNAYFMSFRRYQSRQDDFWIEWQSIYSGNLRNFVIDLTKRYPFL